MMSICRKAAMMMAKDLSRIRLEKPAFGPPAAGPDLSQRLAPGVTSTPATTAGVQAAAAANQQAAGQPQPAAQAQPPATGSWSPSPATGSTFYPTGQGPVTAQVPKMANKNLSHGTLNISALAGEQLTQLVQAAKRELQYRKRLYRVLERQRMPDERQHKEPLASRLAARFSQEYPGARFSATSSQPIGDLPGAEGYILDLAGETSDLKPISSRLHNTNLKSKDIQSWQPNLSKGIT